MISYFSGEMTPEEWNGMEKWLEQSPQNRQMAKDFYAIYLATQTSQTVRQTDVAKAFVETRQRMLKRKVIYGVRWIQRTAAVLFVPLLVLLIFLLLREDPMQHIEFRTNPGMVATVELPDGSQVWLNSNSWVRYPHKFTGHARRVEMGGEAYFKIEKDKSKRFVVCVSPDFYVEALGTEFNVEAYPKSMEVATTLVSGSVKLSYTNALNGEHTCLLKPDERLSYNTKTRETALMRSNVPVLTAWKDGRVILKNTPLKETLDILSKRFDVDFIVTNTSYYENSFTYSSDIQHLSMFLEAFKVSSGIQYRFVESDKHTSDSTKPAKTIVELY